MQRFHEENTFDHYLTNSKRSQIFRFNFPAYLDFIHQSPILLHVPLFNSLCRYINDCRNPAGYNVFFDKRPDEGCAYVIAKRDIMIGEELFADYGRWYWLSLKPMRLSFRALQALKGLPIPLQVTE